MSSISLDNKESSKSAIWASSEPELFSLLEFIVSSLLSDFTSPSSSNTSPGSDGKLSTLFLLTLLASDLFPSWGYFTISALPTSQSSFLSALIGCVAKSSPFLFTPLDSDSLSSTRMFTISVLHSIPFLQTSSSSSRSALISCFSTSWHSLFLPNDPYLLSSNRGCFTISTLFLSTWLASAFLTFKYCVTLCLFVVFTTSVSCSVIFSS